MATVSGTHSNIYSVHAETTDVFLFSTELDSAPQMGTQLLYTPLSGPPVTYKVEMLVWLVEQISWPQSGDPPPPAVVYTKAAGKITVSVVP